MSWALLFALAAIAYVFKAIGVLWFGNTELTGRMAGLVGLLPAALLAALVAVETFAEGQRLTVDARAVGLAFAAFAVWRRWSFTIVVVGAAAATALARWVA